MAKLPPSLVTFLVTAGFFFGGAAIGTALAYWCAPNSAILAIVSFLTFPLAMFLGFPAWLGSAFVTFLFQGIWQRRNAQQRNFAKLVPPGSWVFVPVAIAVFIPAALTAGFTAERMSFMGAAILYLVMGTAYGIGMWHSAKSGRLPFPEEA